MQIPTSNTSVNIVQTYLQIRGTSMNIEKVMFILRMSKLYIIKAIFKIK